MKRNDYVGVPVKRFLVGLVIGMVASASMVLGAEPGPDAENESPDRRGPGPFRSPDRNPDADPRKGHEPKRGIPDPIREKLESLPPEQRARFLENWQKWRSLDDKERQRIREQVVAEHFAVDKALEAMIEKAGLELDRDQQELFALRLRQERRKADEKIREEVRKLRAEFDEEILARLKAEFESQQKVPTE